MRVLVTGHGVDRAAVNAARRLVAYDRLVVFTPDPRSEDLAELEENEGLAGVDVQVRPVDAFDLVASRADAEAVLLAHARDDRRVHVAGGPNLLTSALLLAAFHHGVEAFYCHPRGVSRLPVWRAVDVGSLFTPVEEAVLVALPPKGRTPLGELANDDRRLEDVQRALVQLRKRGLVDASPRHAALTPTGAYYRAHLARDAGPPS